MIWCVEDDASIRDIEVYALRSAGFDAEGFTDGESFWQALQEKRRPSLVILDVMLPGIDGIELLKRLKASPQYEDIATIMATAKGSEYDKVLGLDLGADYYLTKPFGVMELLACVRAVLRRNPPLAQRSLTSLPQSNKGAATKSDSKTSAPATDDSPILGIPSIIMNLEQHRVYANDKEISLTYKEFELLKLFLNHPGRTFTRQQFMKQIWGTDFCGETRTVDMHIRTLRKKLGLAGAHIKTIRNVGYRLEA